MKVYLLNTVTENEEPAKIARIQKKEIPLKKNGWNFNWKELYKIEGAVLYKISTNQSPSKVEGVLMLTLFNDEMVFMNNIELAPHNIGMKKVYDYVAGSLLAFACQQSFELGRGSYQGFLSFDSKTELIELYQNKYGATWAMGHKMYFDPVAGKKLMKAYLGTNK